MFQRSEDAAEGVVRFLISSRMITFCLPFSNCMRVFCFTVVFSLCEGAGASYRLGIKSRRGWLHFVNSDGEKLDRQGLEAPFEESTRAGFH